jgi:hypothetical protein
VRADELLVSLKARFKGNKADEIIIGADELADWPDGVFATFEQDKLVTQAAPAGSIECTGCEDACFMPVNILPPEAGRPARAFIACTERDDVGRVRVEFPRLRQWRMTRTALEKIESRFILAGNGNSDSSLKKAKAPAAFRAALLDLLAEIGRRAEAQGLHFSPAVMPSRKVDFKALADAYDAELRGLALATFDDYLIGICTFRRGARETDFYRRLFPEAFK